MGAGAALQGLGMLRDVGMMLGAMAAPESGIKSSQRRGRGKLGFTEC